MVCTECTEAAVAVKKRECDARISLEWAHIRSCAEQPRRHGGSAAAGGVTHRGPLGNMLTEDFSTYLLLTPARGIARLVAF